MKRWFITLAVVAALLVGCSGESSSAPSDTNSEDISSSVAISSENSEIPDMPDSSVDFSSSSEQDALPAQSTSVSQGTGDVSTQEPQGSKPEQPSTQPEQPAQQPEAQQEKPAQQPEETPAQQPETSKPAETTPPAEEPPAQVETPVQSSGTYVGSVESDKYHVPGCRFAKKILPENEIWFDSAEDAQNAGYSPCGVCHPSR